MGKNDKTVSGAKTVKTLKKAGRESHTNGKTAKPPGAIKY